MCVALQGLDGRREQDVTGIRKRNPEGGRYDMVLPRAAAEDIKERK